MMPSRGVEHQTLHHELSGKLSQGAYAWCKADSEICFWNLQALS